MTLRRDAIHVALPKKGFQLEGDSDHDYFFLEVGGKRTGIRTKTSRGSSHREIGQPLIGQMARQVKLTSGDFVELVACTLSGPDYLAKLYASGDLKP